jgi:hypothetical protein
MASRALLDPGSSYPLPASFILQDYLETEREFWALFPETQGRRVNFRQAGLTEQLYTEVSDAGDELKSNEVYFLMPCEDRSMCPVRHLTVSQYRISRLTVLKLGTYHVHHKILGTELLAEEEDWNRPGA